MWTRQLLLESEPWLLPCFFVLLLAALAAGILAFVVLGEAWLLQEVFDAELWQIALVVLASMAVVMYVVTRFLTAASMLGLPFTEEDDDEEKEEDEEPIGPPLWRQSPSSGKQNKSKSSRR